MKRESRRNFIYNFKKAFCDPSMVLKRCICKLYGMAYNIILCYIVITNLEDSSFLFLLLFVVSRRYSYISKRVALPCVMNLVMITISTFTWGKSRVSCWKVSHVHKIIIFDGFPSSNLIKSMCKFAFRSLHR